MSQVLGQRRSITTPRLSLLPPGPEHLPDLIRLKADEAVFGYMLHGTRTPERTREELEDELPVSKRRADDPRRTDVRVIGEKLDQLEAFASFNGADFYGLPRNTGTITLKRESWTPPESFQFGEADLKPLRSGEALPWRVA